MTTRNTTRGPEPEHAADALDGAVPGGWSAVVYGRTLRVDQWWRALPAGVDRQGPVGDAVRAAVAGGSRLEYGPRFLLHRDIRGVLVGAACELGLISREMVQDRFGRPLYGFVGWYRPASADTGGRVPTLAELTGHLADWAGPVYTEWIAPTWEAVGREEAEPWTTRPVAAPWPERAPGAAGGPAVPSAWRPALPAGTHLLPEADAHGVWAAAAAGPGRCVLVTGWRRRSDADADRLTHLTSADCQGYELLRPPPPPPPPTPPVPPKTRPVPEQGPASKPGAKQGAKSDAKSDGKSGSSPWGRTARGLGKLGKAMADVFWSEEPEQPETGRNEPERAERPESTPKRTDGQTSDHRPSDRQPSGGQAPGVRPGGGTRFGQARVPGRDPYDGLGEPLPGPARPAPYGGERAAPPTPPTPNAPPAPNAPAAPPEAPPRWRNRSVDPQQADLSGMFGDFDDDPEPPPPTAPTIPAPTAPAPSDPPAQPPKGPCTDPGDRTDPATGGPS
ncbi:hypothetical protein [Kitasatospora sp. NPDC008115]|uniref:hypothetical protein n=1 Tax=Kitasatospora sp. NPDC008115 TaxID=3364022 RepID=UPI0036ED24FC